MRSLPLSLHGRFAGAVAMVASTAVLVACAPDTSVPPPSEPPPADLVVVDFSVNEAHGIRATGTHYTDAYGTYRQVELADDAPAREFARPAYATDVIELYGEDLAAAGQSFAAAFVAEHYLDNPAVYDNSSQPRFAHRDTTVELIAPAQSQNWVDDVMESASGWATDKQVLLAIEGGAGVPPYAAGEARYALRTFELESATVNEADRGIVFTFHVEYDRPMVSSEADAYLTTTGTYIVVVVADISEKWYVSGWGQDVDSTMYYWDGSATQREIER